MRVVLRILFYLAVLAALGWVLPQIAASLHRATSLDSTADASRAYALFAGYLLIGGALAVIVAWDVSRFFGGIAGQLFWGGGRLPSITPAWWKAERLCREHRPVEAVQVLRDYLNSHPRQWRVAVRIAEIYQHKADEPLAAVLEYEELLKRRLPDSARAEILLRQAACYLLLRDTERAAAKLGEVIENFPATPAAEKARRRLARMDSPL